MQHEGNRILDILIATHDIDGLEKVGKMTLPVLSGVRYIVSCQSPPLDIPEALKRNDMEIHFSDSRGLSVNRNVLLGLSEARYALVSDNDLSYISEGLRAVMEALEGHPDVDIATFRHIGPSPKIYPGEITVINGQKGGSYFVTSFEIAMRMDSIRRSGLQFSELMSIGGSYLGGGEEELLLLNAFRLGLKCCFFPIDICRHRDLTSGFRSERRRGILRGEGAMLLLKFGVGALPRIPVAAMRHKGNRLKNLLYLTQGMVYGIRHKKQLLITSIKA